MKGVFLSIAQSVIGEVFSFASDSIDMLDVLEYYADPSSGG